MASGSSIKYGLLKSDPILELNENTKKQYISSIEKFSKFAKSELKMSKMYQLEGKEKETIQAWADKLKADKKSPATIHTYLAAVCKACGVDMADIRKPERTCAAITRSRHYAGENERGMKDMKNPKFERLVRLAEVTGIRRDEYMQLKGSDLQRDVFGVLCVHVPKGKGGKEQYQRILPQHEGVVESIFKGVKSSDFVFSKAELNNDIDLHRLRAKNAQEAYKYYVDRMEREPGYRNQLRFELCERFKQFRSRSAEDYVKFTKSFRDGMYVTRGTVREVAECNGKPVAYDRTALMAVSVFHLSHWRADVTVVNYLVNSLI